MDISLYGDKHTLLCNAFQPLSEFMTIIAQKIQYAWAIYLLL